MSKEKLPQENCLTREKASTPVKKAKIRLSILNEQRICPVSMELRSLWRKSARIALAGLPFVSPVEVCLLLADNEHIRELNNCYRDKDMPTDVLSFPQFEKLLENSRDISDIPTGELLLGDIVVSLERAEAQAEELGHSFEREVVFLFVHGLLHLLGYDHERPEDELLMTERQEQIMNKLGLTR